MAPANGREPKNLNFVTTILGSTLLEKQLQFGKGETVPSSNSILKDHLKGYHAATLTLFLLQTDSNDATDAISGDLKFAVDSEKGRGGAGEWGDPFFEYKNISRGFGANRSRQGFTLGPGHNHDLARSCGVVC